MRYRLLLTIGVVSLCRGTTPLAYRTECSLLEDVGNGAKPELSTRPVALEILERVGEGRMERTDAALEERVGLKPGQLRGPAFTNYVVRSCAFRIIGNLDFQEALEYLQNLKREDLAPDSTQQVWPAAQIALREAQMRRVPDEAGKVRILEDAVVNRSPSAVWAVEQLCDRGSAGSLAIVETYYRKGYSEPRASQFYEFCKAQVEILSTNPDPVLALGSALSAAKGLGNKELVGWTIEKLAAMKSPRAYVELERYMNEINALPSGSPLKNREIPFAQRIRDLLPTPTTGERRH